MRKTASIIVIIIFIYQEIGFGSQGEGLLRPVLQCSGAAKELMRPSVESPEYQVMLRAMKQLIEEDLNSPGYNNAYSYIRGIAENELREFDAGRADDAILEIKKWLIKASFSPAVRKRIRRMMLNQSREYFDLVNGFGAIAYNADIDQMEDLIPREEIHEDIFFASKQAVDTLEEMGEIGAVSELLALTRRGLESHKEKVDMEVMQKRVDNARKQQNEDDERRYNIILSSNFEAIRRWMSMENMLLKCISNLGLRAGDTRAEFREAQSFLSEVMLDYKARGEAYYWVRKEAACRLHDYTTEEAIAALNLARDKTRPEGQAPHPSTVFVSMNLEAANPNALTIGLDAGMSLLHIQRVRAEKEVIANPGKFDFEQKQYRFVRLLGALDALRREDVNNDIRIRIMERIAGIRSDEAAFGANFLLDAMEEMVKGQRNKYARIFTSDRIAKELEDPRIRQAALKVISRIARTLLPRLEAKNALLARELSKDIGFLDRVSQGRDVYDMERFRKIGRKLHVTLGNLHRLDEFKSFDQGEEYLNFNRNVVIGSGGGASVSMSGVIDRITTDPALAIIGATDNGGATLLVRSFEAVQNGIFVGGFGDHIRFMYEAAVLEGAPGALMIRDILNHRFGQGTKTLVEEIKAQYPDKLKKARQSGPKEEERFEEVYKKLLEAAAKVDVAGLSGDFNSVKNMILEGLMYQTEGIGGELMNPDGIYAAFEAFRRLVGAKSMAIPDIPIGNEIIVRAADGEEYIGQSYYSHTPRGFSRGRQRATLRITDVSNYYPEVAIRSRIMGVVSRAKLLLFGLGSWATSVGILFKNRALVSAVADNTSADKTLITNPVCDDETRGMTWRESTVNFLEYLMGRSLGDVFNRVLANANRNLDRLILTARPHLGTVRQVYDGYFGGYAGENTPMQEDIAYLKQKNVQVLAGLDMVSVKLSPMRMNPDLYNATIQYVPERFAEGLWSLMSDTAKESLGTKSEIELIKRKDEIERLLRGKGLTLLDLGLEQIHEVIFNPVLVRELSEWLNEGKVPVWIEDKDARETIFQFIVKKAAERSTGHVLAGTSTSIRLGEEMTITRIRDKDVKIKFLNPQETDENLPGSRVSLGENIEDLRNEELHRLGVIRGYSDGQNDILILLPYDLLEAGDTPENRIRRISAALSFQLKKAEYLLTNNFNDEAFAHNKALKYFNSGVLTENKDYGVILAELSAAIPYLRFLRSTTAEGKIPNTILDMDGTFTAAGTPLTPEMAYHAWKFFKSAGSLKTVMTAQQFEGPFKQIVEEVEQITRRLRWIAVHTGVDLEAGTAESDFMARVPIAVSSGGAIFLWDNNETRQGYVKVCQESMDDFTVSFIELAARLTMPDVGYSADGHQIELREPHRQPDGSILFAAMAVIPSGRYDTRRNWDPRPACVQRILQGNRMTELLKNPANLLKQVEGFFAKGGVLEWTLNKDDSQTIITLQNAWELIIGSGDNQEKILVLPGQYEAIKVIYEQIQRLMAKNPALIEKLNKSIDISHQPGGDTTNDFSAEGKGPRIPIVVGAVGIMTDGNAEGLTINFVPTAPGASPTDKGPRIPMVKQAIEYYEGIAATKTADAFLGDEMHKATILHDGKVMKAAGNDFSVAQETMRGAIHPRLLLHVGATGEKIETLPNTSTLYGEAGLMPHDTDYLLAYSIANVHRGKVCEQIEKNADIKKRIEEVLVLCGRSLSEFGIESFETMNERQAQELFLWLGYYNEDKVLAPDIPKFSNQELGASL
ncbi:MAG: 2-phospho-L-lactate transferase CofD family protein [Candidatus Omnitrophota bacterium]|nr:2-phospho-L-lactate transferase CofD family protein [Candidatus Omnitrophota bacterium]